jgi:hypothetical protein
MAFRYIDNNGTSFNLSNNTLRKELMLLKGVVEDETDYPVVSSETEDANLLSLYAKLNITVEIITENDLKQRLSNENDIDTLSFIFSLNKTHFKAIVYLIYEKSKGSEFIQTLIEANVKTRNRILLNEFEYDISVEEKNFYNPLLKLLPKFFSPLSISVNINENIKNFSIIDIASNVYPEMFYVLKAEFFILLFQNVIWNKNTNSNTNIKQDSKNKRYKKNYGFTSLFLNVKEEHEEYDDQGRKQDVKSYLEFLYRDPKDRDKNSEIRTISSVDATSYMMNTYFMEAVRLYSEGKISLSDQRGGLNETLSYLIETGIKESINYEISDTASKPYNFNMLYHLYFMYNNSLNYRTLNSFNFFNIPSGFENIIENSSLEDTILDFEYIDDAGLKLELTPLKNFLKSIFFEVIPNERHQLNYSSSYFFNILKEDGNYRGYRYNRSTESYIKSRYDTFIKPVFDNRIFISSSGIIFKIGNGLLQDYFQRAIMLSLQTIKNDQSFSFSLDPISYDTFESAVEGIEAIRDYIVENIMAQTIDTNEYANSTNTVFKFFLIDLVKKYFNYLINDEELGDFNFVGDDDTIKSYKLLNFIKHIFIVFNTFYESVKLRNSYLNFNLFLLATKNFMTKKEIKNALTNLTFAELENMFKE